MPQCLRAVSGRRVPPLEGGKPPWRGRGIPHGSPLPPEVYWASEGRERSRPDALGFTSAEANPRRKGKRETTTKRTLISGPTSGRGGPHFGLNRMGRPPQVAPLSGRAAEVLVWAAENLNGTKRGRLGAVHAERRADGTRNRRAAESGSGGRPSPCPEIPRPWTREEFGSCYAFHSRNSIMSPSGSRTSARLKVPKSTGPHVAVTPFPAR